MMHLSTVLLLATAVSTNAQSLLEAISHITELSNFTAFYSANEAFANALFGNESLYPITVLVPNNKAFAAYQEKYGISLTDASPQALLPLVQYHTLVSSLNKDNFTSGSGATTPTLLVDKQYNNRSVGTSMAAKYGGAERSSGQVVFIKQTSGSTSKFRLSRQAGGSTESVRSGLSSSVNMTALDDSENTWKGGKFHIIDGLLTPPDLCATTIRGAGLSSLDNALNRTSLWGALDGTANLTCLGPNNEAFKSAGNADSTLNTTDLTGAILFHTLPEVAYSDYLSDGQEFKSLQNMTVRVKVEGEGSERQIWFNNAKVVDANVLTHNGLMHVLDSVMKPLEELNATASASPSSTQKPTATASNTASAAASSTGAAVANVMSRSVWGLGLLGAVMVMF
ncbi:FAS1 domain-containing protein [Lindgomyces ingoldianus]|uniref:FAS1 domain-containing protein n=1 Tax=Lindgomyces ingoldianus TaxID=673940 RepID=A0ACB6R962_9PLEO|nr:FAS1 domain-containing protein [Lindgomyces ingoldianus]KAF2475794.1 FAS1 domain-containing protein [Lindgomyces ingoldianus]